MTKAWWLKQEARINGLSVRERVFLFFSVLVCLFAIADTFWMTPAQNAQRQMAQKFNAQGAELDRLRMELAAAGAPKDASHEARTELAQIQAQSQAQQTLQHHPKLFD